MLEGFEADFAILFGAGFANPHDATADGVQFVVGHTQQAMSRFHADQPNRPSPLVYLSWRLQDVCYISSEKRRRVIAALSSKPSRSGEQESGEPQSIGIRNQGTGQA